MLIKCGKLQQKFVLMKKKKKSNMEKLQKMKKKEGKGKIFSSSRFLIFGWKKSALYAKNGVIWSVLPRKMGLFLNYKTRMGTTYSWEWGTQGNTQSISCIIIYFYLRTSPHLTKLLPNWTSFTSIDNMLTTLTSLQYRLLI